MDHPIKQIRTKYNLTQIELGVILDVTPAFIAQIEQGAPMPPRLLNNLCSYLKIDPEKLKKEIKKHNTTVKEKLLSQLT